MLIEQEVRARGYCTVGSCTACLWTDRTSSVNKLSHYMEPLLFQPYSMRNGVLGVMGKLVILRLSQDDLNENMKKTRDQVLDHLEVSFWFSEIFMFQKVFCLL